MAKLKAAPTINPNAVSIVQDLIDANTRQNLKIIGKFPSVSRVPFRGRSVVIIGAGPSLADDLHLLHRVKKGIIICAAHAWRSLHAKGIRPDFVIHVDPQEKGMEFFAGLPVRQTKAFLGCSTHPSFFRLPWSQIYGYQSGDCPISRSRRITFPVFSGGSVSHDAFYIAARLQASAIVLLGMDCCGGYIDGEHPGEQTYEVMGKDGPIKTRWDLWQFWHWWNLLGSKKPFNQVWLNCSKGALFSGFGHCDFKKALKIINA